MVDRLEELLALLETKEDQENEDRTDALIPPEGSVPATVPTEEDGGGQVPVAPAGDGTRAGDRAPEGAPVSGEDGERELVWTVKQPAAELETALRRTAEALPHGGAERLEEPDRARVRGEPAWERLENPERTRMSNEPVKTAQREEKSGLEELYRQTARSARSAVLQIPSPEQAGRTIQTGEPGRTAAVTVEELDRAVRRDSRRYDGGMAIF